MPKLSIARNHRLQAPRCGGNNAAPDHTGGGNITRTSRLLGGGALALARAVSLPATAQIAVSGNDNTRRLENGVHRVVPHAPADTITIIDLNGRAPRVLG